ncbi:MAG: 8-oxoguanine deaminase [Nocardioides sp.]|nr:8-oxoguanine deaminase [Nocardioides sp.]
MTSEDVVRDGRADLLVRDARLLVTMDAERRELPGGWVAIADGQVVATGTATTPPPAAARVGDASGCLVTPGLVNAHHHLFQNYTRAWPGMTGGSLFPWMSACFPVWAGLDDEAAYLAAWVGLAELALSGCTASTDMHYFHVAGGGDMVAATIAAAVEVGLRFHPSRACISRCGSTEGGVIPDSIIQSPDEILAECERLVGTFHQPGRGAMVQIAFAPSMTFMMGRETTLEMVELAERLDVRMHTHVAESADDDAFCLETFGRTDFEHFEHVGLATPRTWVAHCVRPTPAEMARLAARGVAVAHCPSSNAMLGSGIAPVRDLLSAGVRVGLGVDGSSSNDAGSLWLEARQALMVGKLRDGPAAMQSRDVLEMATRGGAACLGRPGELGELSPGSAGDLAIWDLNGLSWPALDVADPVEAWLRCGPVAARHTVVAGRLVVEDGRVLRPEQDDILLRHAATARRLFDRAQR